MLISFLPTRSFLRASYLMSFGFFGFTTKEKEVWLLKACCALSVNAPAYWQQQCKRVQIPLISALLFWSVLILHSSSMKIICSLLVRLIIQKTDLKSTINMNWRLTVERKRSVVDHEPRTCFSKLFSWKCMITLVSLSLACFSSSRKHISVAFALHVLIARNNNVFVAVSKMSWLLVISRMKITNHRILENCAVEEYLMAGCKDNGLLF